MTANRSARKRKQRPLRLPLAWPRSIAIPIPIEPCRVEYESRSRTSRRDGCPSFLLHIRETRLSLADQAPILRCRSVDSYAVLHRVLESEVRRRALFLFRRFQSARFGAQVAF